MTTAAEMEAGNAGWWKVALVTGFPAALVVLHFMEFHLMVTYTMPYFEKAASVPSLLDYHMWIFIPLFLSSLYNTIRYTIEVYSVVSVR